MSMTSTLATLATKEALRPLPAPSWLFGVGALCIFAALLGILWCFRNTGLKAQGGPRQAQHEHGGHGPAEAHDSTTGVQPH